MNTRIKGKRAEELAAEYLISQGFVLLGKNSFFKGGEIDLIMLDKDFIVFVEVKSNMKDNAVTIYETLSQTKKHRLKNSINKWLLKENRLAEPWRLDFVGIVYDNSGKYEVEHFKFIDIN